MTKTESQTKRLMRNGWTYVKGAKEYHELAAYAEAEDYQVSEGHYLPRSMKTYAEMTKAELHMELRWYKKHLQRIAKGQLWADWVTFNSYTDPSYEIINELRTRGLRDYDRDMIGWWESARNKAENLLNEKYKMEA